MSEAIANYVEKVVPNTHKQWRKKEAHSVKYDYPEQSLFWHTTGAALLAFSILDYFRARGYGEVANEEEAALCATLHDLDRESEGEKREHELTLEDLAAARTRLNLDEYAAMLTNEDLLWVTHNEHLFRRQGHFGGLYGNNRLSALVYLTALTDGLAVIGNPREVLIPRKRQRDRALAPLLEAFSSDRLELVYHQLNTVTGFVSNLLHSAMVELLHSALPEAEPEPLQQLAFFPNGTVYIAPKGTFEARVKVIGANEFLSRLADGFYDKFKGVMEKTEQFVGLEKGQPTPKEFAFLMDAVSLVEAALHRQQRRWSIAQKQRQRLRQIEEELTREALAQRDRRRLEAEQKKHTDNLSQFTQQIKEQLEKLLAQRSDFAVRYGTLPENFDWAELKVVSDYFAFITRLADAYGLGREVLKQTATVLRIAEDDVAGLTVNKSGGVNYQAILLAYHLLSTPPPTVEAHESDDFLAAVEAAQAEQVTVMERLETLSQQLAFFFSENVKMPQQKRAMVNAKLLTKEEADAMDGDTPLEQTLLQELAAILAEHLEVNGQAFPAKPVETRTLCNFCGRQCKGITLSAKMTPVDTPTAYSGYNMAESTDRKPRQVCALCFFENVLRTALFPNRGKGLTLFVFPEYSFTRHHAHIFRKQVRDVFPKALAEDETTVEEGEPDALVAAIQHALKAKPEAADADAVLPVYVAPLSGDTSLSQWLSHTRNLLGLWDGLGLKYILTSDFYPEVEGIGNVKGVVELRGCHPQLSTRLRRWMQAIRSHPIQGLPDTALTIREAEKVRELMEAVGDLAGDKRNEEGFYTASGLFAGAVLYGKQKAKKKKGA